MSARSTFKYPFPEHMEMDMDRTLSLIKDCYMLNRSAVNEDTDQLVDRLQNELDAKVYEIPAATECLSWIVPNNWKVRKGQLKTMEGEVLVDFDDNPLHLWTHSVAFSGVIDRDDLIKNHVDTDEYRPDEFTYHYRNGYRSGVREWGFSIPYNIVKNMNDDQYVVEIDADLDADNTLKVVDAFLPGEYEDTIFIMAHTCHPALISDGLGCIAIAAEIYHWLKSQENRRYSYRFIFGPEYFGALGWLTSAPQQDIDNLKYGIYLDMLTTYEPIGYQVSMHGDSFMDKSVANVFENHFQTCVVRDYRKLWGNDETFYNGPGFGIPTIGIGRHMHREYHYNTDNFDNVSPYHIKESYWGLKRLIQAFETDYIPILKYKGPLYLSRHGLYVDPVREPAAYQNIERMQSYVDGKRSCMDIANELDADFYFVKGFFDQIFEKGLIEKQPRSSRETDKGTVSTY